MPTYEYYCSKCNKEFEVFQSMADNALVSCPKDRCQQKKWGKGKVKRIIGAGAGLIFKGSGFYITDYRSEGYKEAAKKDAPASATDKKSDKSKKADAPKSTKPEAKSADKSKSK